MRAFPLPSHDLAAVALFIDVTHVERLEELRREFIADFSHEVRTPLAALKSAVETFEFDRGLLTDDQEASSAASCPASSRDWNGWRRTSRS